MECCTIILLLLVFHAMHGQGVADGDLTTHPDSLAHGGYSTPDSVADYSTPPVTQYEFAGHQTESSLGCGQELGGPQPEFSFTQPTETENMSQQKEICDVTTEEAGLGSTAPVQPERKKTGGQDTSGSDLYNLFYEVTIAFLQGVAVFLTDIFSALNSLNLSLQGKGVYNFYVQDKMEASIKKLGRWSSKVKESSFDAFPLLNDFLESYGIRVNEETVAAMKEHLEALASSVKYLF
ncbi:uncharacterized protein LOC126298137 [Schistocerca gregaria]|uniref:uncharacterized protein LOC126298137 n=1 Tax=Schistocerca gregaria TaxID=7010 RepID=UPI00211DC868|nr:uncharacterized protein LOC126298137 [Schistocerca gregaria]